MKLYDFRSDFRMGRTGDGLRINQEAQAYRASVYDAENMMVLANGHLKRRWGTLDLTTFVSDLPQKEGRIESWVYADRTDLTFILLFYDAQLIVLDSSLTEKLNVAAPWDSDTLWFMNLTNEGNKLVITDQAFQPRVLTYNPDSNSFSLDALDLDVSEDKRRLRSPFFQFVADDLIVTPTIFTAAGVETAYGPHIEAALSLPAGSYDIAAGEGRLTASAPLFEAGHAGTRGQIGDGEFEILSVTSTTQAEIRVYRDLARKLDEDPFFMKPESDRVEVTCEKHNLAVGDRVFFYGITHDVNDQAKEYLENAPLKAKEDGTAPVPSGTPALYEVKRVIDENFFEIEGDTFKTDPEPLNGGPDVHMIPEKGFSRMREQVFSPVRGWPQASVFHEQRLWLGGTTQLPDAVWGSRIANLRDFDPGEGNQNEAVTMYGIGSKSRVRHLVSSFDLVILTDNAEFYTPGSTEKVITQESARAIRATAYGCAYTAPQIFDMGIFFLDAEGVNVREMAVTGEERQYSAPPVSVVVPDWINQFRQSTIYQGSPRDVTPYVIFSQGTDGSMVVMHSSRADGAFGFMRWTLARGEFVSCTGAASRLYALAKRGDEYRLLRFDTTTKDYRLTVDFAVQMEVFPGITEVTEPLFANQEVVIYDKARLMSRRTADENGRIVFPEPLESFTAGDEMPWRVEMNAPITGTGGGSRIGKMQRLVSCEIAWVNTVRAEVHGQPALDGHDAPSASVPEHVDEWRQYHVGEWGREPRLVIKGNDPGEAGMRGIVLNVYF